MDQKTGLQLGVILLYYHCHNHDRCTQTHNYYTYTHYKRVCIYPHTCHVHMPYSDLSTRMGLQWFCKYTNQRV